MGKSWKLWPHDDCPECGNSLEVETISEIGGCYDGDSVRCVECIFRSGMSVDDDGTAWVQEPHITIINA